MVQRSLTLCILLFIASITKGTLFGLILTCPTLEDLKPHITDNTLCVFDFDNTLFECVDAQQGSDQWFAAAIKYCQAQGDAHALETVISRYQEKHKTALIKPAENCTIPFLESLLAHGIPVIILTSRSIIHETERELKNIQEAPINEFSFIPFHMDKEETIYFPLSQEQAVYQNGIMFCGKNKKSEALNALIKKYHLNPEKILFVDDRLHHISDVLEKINIGNVPCFGFHYTHLAYKIDNFVFNPTTF